jgi:hypothetical protein
MMRPDGRVRADAKGENPAMVDLVRQEMVRQLLQVGFAGPVPLLAKSECSKILAHEASGQAKAGIDWIKGRAAADPFYAALAADERLTSLLRPLLGPDIILWGVDILRRSPDQVHPWHCDIESCSPEGGFLSIWIGIENASKESALNCISYSHKFGHPFQAVAHSKGYKRGEPTTDMVLSWAQEFDPEAALLVPDIQDGDAIIFDGRLWHGTNNIRSEGTRTAVLLQYASASCPVRMPDFKRLEWPFQYATGPRPPVLVVSGAGNASVNRIVEAPQCT